MADYISDIKHINPTYPVKPVQPTQKDRETDRRDKPKHKTPEKDDNEEHDGDHRPTIDEHV